MQTVNLFHVAWFALAFEILWAINTARLAKKQEVIGPMGVPATLAFIAFHTCWWMSEARNPQSIAMYVIGAIASVAFMFGTAFITTGCMKLTDCGELCINKDNKAFQLISRLPIKFDGKSLCSISWLAAVCIFLLLPVMSAIGIITAAITIVVCLWTFQNPWPYYKETLKLEGWPETEMNTFKRGPLVGFYISPVPYLTVLAIIGGILYMIAIAMPTIVGIVGVFLVIYLLGLIAAAVIINKWKSMTTEAKEENDYDLRYSINKLVNETSSVSRSLTSWSVFWQVFKQKFCPRLKYCNKDEMPKNSKYLDHY